MRIPPVKFIIRLVLLFLLLLWIFRERTVRKEPCGIPCSKLTQRSVCVRARRIFVPMKSIANMDPFDLFHQRKSSFHRMYERFTNVQRYHLHCTRVEVCYSSPQSNACSPEMFSFESVAKASYWCVVVETDLGLPHKALRIVHPCTPFPI